MRNTTLAALISLACLSADLYADPEQALHELTVRESAAKMTGLRYHSLNQSGQLAKMKDPMVYWREFIRTCPGSADAAGAQQTILQHLVKSGHYGEALKEGEAFFRDYAAHPAECMEVATLISGIARNKSAPPEIQERALRLALNHCEGNGGLIRISFNSLQKTADWDTLLSYARRAGKDEPDAMESLYLYCRAASQKEDAGQAAKRAGDFMALYGPDNPYRILLAGTPEEVKAYEAAAQAVKRDVSVIKRAMDSGEHASALRMLGEWRKHSEMACADGWRTLFNTSTNVPDAAIRDYAKLAFEIAPLGSTRHLLMNVGIFQRAGSWEPENAAAITPLLKLYFSRPVGRFSAWRTLKMCENRRLRDGQGVTAEVARQYGFSDYSALLLFTAARARWDFDEAQAVGLLKQAIAMSRDSAGAVYADWWLAQLDGRASLSATALPRAPRYLTDFERPATACPDAHIAPAPQPVPTATGEITLPRLNPEVRLTAFAPFVPAQVPADRVCALEQVSTVSEVRVTAADALHFTLELCAADGSLLRFYERSWPFVVISDPQTYQPDAEHLFQIPPCDGVAFIRLRILKRSGPEDGITGLTLSAPAHPMTGLYVLAAQKIESGTQSIRLSCEETTVTNAVKYTRHTENVRIFPAMRWVKPWSSRATFANVGMTVFGGGDMELAADRAGVLNVTTDGRITNRWTKTAAEKERRVLPDPGAGRHTLVFHTSSLPYEHDKHAGDGTWLREITVQGRARAIPCVRFFVNGQWGDYVTGGLVSVPARAKQVQAAVVFDSRSVLGRVSASVRDFKAEACAEPGQAGTPVIVRERPAVTEELSAVAAFVGKNRPAVVFAKNGTKAEYEVARKIADKAGAYLVSDDVGLNDYPGPYLIIGTPLNNRMLRQLAARKSVWEDAAFLNASEGFCALLPQDGDSQGYAFAAAHTPESAVRAAERLLKNIGRFKTKEPFRLFQQSLLDRLYPWQLVPQKESLKKIELTLARCDRRNTAFGIAYEREAQAVSVEVSDLLNGAHKLPPAEARFVGFYEFMNFFGDLHLPDLLVPRPVLPAPARTSQLVVLTVRSPKSVVPGTYRGTVKVTINGDTRSIPFDVEVIRGTLQPGSLAINDYAVMPYYYHDTPRALRDFTRLMDNLAEHGINMPIIQGGDDFVWRKEAGGLVFDFGKIGEKIAIADQAFRVRERPLPQIFLSLPWVELRRLSATAGNLSQGEVSAAYASQLKSWLDANQLSGRTYCSLGDEVLGVIDQWVQWARPFKDAGLKIFVTHAHEKMDAVNAAWCPNYAHQILDLPILSEALKKKEKPVWWYICAGGGPSTRITAPLINGLPAYWLTAKWRLDGVFNNAALHTSEWAYPVPLRRDHGSDTRILFLADGTLIDTVRREVEAEGVQDALLIRARRDAAGTEELLQKTVPYKWQYASDPADWERARNALYDGWSQE